MAALPAPITPVASQPLHMPLNTVASEKPLRFSVCPLPYQNAHVFVVDVQRDALVEDLWQAVYGHPRMKKHANETLKLYKVSVAPCVIQNAIADTPTV